MLRDFNKDQIAETLNADTCIIGAGVAGQTLAMRLKRGGQRVLLIESGGLEFKSSTQKLSDGDVSGEPYYELISSRLRLFGGTAAIWGGRCAELDPIDFEARDFVPHSGWPITKDDLSPFYKRAYEALDIDATGVSPFTGSRQNDRTALNSDRLERGFWRFDENGERFTNLSRGNLEQVDILINATLTKIDVAENGAVTSVTVSNAHDQQAQIKAKSFVMAAGAIETIRLLMGAVPSRPNGLGNSRDLLGRFFMEHPHARGGEIVSVRLATSLRVLPRMKRAHGQRYAAYLRLSEDEQKRQGVLNSALSLAPRRHAGESQELVRALKEKLKHDLPSTKFWRTSYKGLKNLSTLAREQVDPWASVWAVKQSGKKRGLYAVIRAEQAPNPDSRIVLSARKDRYDLPLADLDWQFTDLDKHSVKALMDTLKAEYQRLGWGDVIPARWLDNPSEVWKFDPLVSAHAIGGYHHMGGTRMAATASTGVVDENCRLFESPNLYISSSSVFPTGGWANPTLTIIALAERLGDHLIEAQQKTNAIATG